MPRPQILPEILLDIRNILNEGTHGQARNYINTEYDKAIKAHPHTQKHLTQLLHFLRDWGNKRGLQAQTIWSNDRPTIVFTKPGYDAHDLRNCEGFINVDDRENVFCIGRNGRDRQVGIGVGSYKIAAKTITDWFDDCEPKYILSIGDTPRSSTTFGPAVHREILRVLPSDAEVDQQNGSETFYYSEANKDITFIVFGPLRPLAEIDYEPKPEKPQPETTPEVVESSDSEFLRQFARDIENNDNEQYDRLYETTPDVKALINRLYAIARNYQTHVEEE